MCAVGPGTLVLRVGCYVKDYVGLDVDVLDVDATVVARLAAMKSYLISNSIANFIVLGLHAGHSQVVQDECNRESIESTYTFENRT